MSKYYLIKVDETSDVININKNNQLCLETWNNEYGDSIEIIRNSDSFIELTKEELISLGMSTELVVKVVAMGINVNIKKLQKKIRKVLE